MFQIPSVGSKVTPLKLVDYASSDSESIGEKEVQEDSRKRSRSNSPISYCQNIAKQTKKPKYWKCTSCRASNFDWDEKCRKCKRESLATRKKLWICKCGQNNCSKKDKKCRACGRELNSGKVIESSLWTCKNKYCGEENSTAEKYCGRCARHQSGIGKDITIIWDKKNQRKCGLR